MRSILKQKFINTKFLGYKISIRNLLEFSIIKKFSFNISKLSIVLAILISQPIFSEKLLNVVTTSTDLRYIASQVGGNRVNVISLIRGFDDPHFVMTRPDFLVKLNRADVFCMVGLDLEVGWVPLILEQSRNSSIQKGQNGYCDASVGIKILGKPTMQVDRSMGDMHIFGNPHYWSDPVNVIQIARTMTEAFSRVDPEHKDYYNKNYSDFKAKLVDLVKTEMKKFEPYFGSRVAVFHDEFLYLANRFRFNANLTLEERPGVPPSSRYLEQIIRSMIANNIKVILVSPVNNRQYAEYVSSRVPDSVVIVMPTSVEAIPEAITYEDTIRISLDKIRTALDKTNTRGNK
ncbi:metal ABC transporter substrate-binding protein [Leptospira sp. GIMC2001]|uniref:metal ABC transporter substrate-binding protein n=1 Tax=Leptospira sp. GIMC2001 TaxID=1513297 RepID=UPI0004A5C4A5|nr:metal ABC transporter substrate-binding protein [Leptospira sp. GIMC2001]AID56185.1 zinc ABC transporter periplasmic-binding protein ZnuA [Leptospira sp. GIMC2001]WCL48357.1 metal ABC transporter substrate-binding protein [Leptospira sp. GIMC2001]